MLKLRTIGIRDYSVLEGEQRIGRIRFADERMPGVWLWNVVVHLTGGLPMGSSRDLDTAKAEFKAAWEVLKARITPEQLAAAYKAMNIRMTTTEGHADFPRPPAVRACGSPHFGSARRLREILWGRVRLAGRPCRLVALPGQTRLPALSPPQWRLSPQWRAASLTPAIATSSGGPWPVAAAAAPVAA